MGYTVLLLFLKPGDKFLLVFLSSFPPSPRRSYQSFRLLSPFPLPKDLFNHSDFKRDRKCCLQQPWLSHPLLLKVSEVKNLNELDYLLRTNEWKIKGNRCKLYLSELPCHTSYYYCTEDLLLVIEYFYKSLSGIASHQPEMWSMYASEKA